MVNLPPSQIDARHPRESTPSDRQLQGDLQIFLRDPHQVYSGPLLWLADLCCHL